MIFTDADGNITTPKSLTYTVTTSGYTNYFSIEDGKITSDEETSATDSSFEIEVVATSYGDGTEQTATLTVYLTEVKILDSDAKSEIEEISIVKGETVTVYVQALGSSGTLSVITEEDGIKASLSNTSTTKNSKTVYELTIYGEDTGTASLSIIEGNGKATKDLEVSVYDAEIDQTEINFDSLSQTETVTVTLGSNFDIDESSNYINWTTSDEDVVTVEADGLEGNITSVGYGVAIVYCEVVVDNEEIATFKIGVAVTGIELDDVIMTVGDEQTIGSDIESYISSDSIESVSWSSDNEYAVEISESGIFYATLNAVDAGTANITLEISIEDDDGTVNTFSYMFTVTVNE